MLCPVCISSTNPLSVPVRAHWAANWVCERRAMRTVVAIAAGTTSSEMIASSGLIVSMIRRTPTTVSTEVIAWVIVCWRVVAMLSMSFVTRLSVSPAGMAVEVAQRQTGELEVDLLDGACRPSAERRRR